MKLPLGAHCFVLYIVHDLASSSACLQCVEVCADVPPPPPPPPVRRGDVLAAWSGLRPLVMDPNKKDTQSIARNHVIEVSDSKLITISGGECMAVFVVKDNRCT